jgi:DNA repair protein RadC
MRIKQLALGDRPREKLLKSGISSLTDSELLAILIGSGSREESAVALAGRILESLEHDLHTLARLSVSDLQRFKGIGDAKAISIAAAMELGRRRQMAEVRTRPGIKSSKDAFTILSPFLKDLQHEEFWVLMLNRSHKLIRSYCVSKGGVTGTVVDCRLIYKEALHHLATALILAHNHPSGNLKPSRQDIALTNKLKEAGQTLDIQVLDHLIITQGGYYSFADEGQL